MKILRAINNNVISCLDDSGKELVVMGRGLGFCVKIGQEPDARKIEKIFRMESPENISRLKTLIARLPEDLLALCAQIIDYARQNLERKLNESIYLTLTDHIQFAIERCSMGMDLHNALITEVRVYYPQEYAIGQHALELIQEKLHVILPGSEAASIALHIINAEYDSSINATMHVAMVLQPIVEIADSWPGLSLQKNHLFYDELIVHLKFLAMEVFTGQPQNWLGEGLCRAARADAPEAYACAQAIGRYLHRQSGHKISQAETAYLAICIHRCDSLQKIKAERMF